MNEETLKDTLPKFAKSLEDKGRSPSTVLAYRADIEQLIEFLQEKSKVLPSQVSKLDIDTFRDNLLNQKYTPKSVSRKLNAIKTFFRWAVKNDIIIKNPADNVEHPLIKNTLPKFLKPLEYRALRDVSRDDNRIAAIVELILQTGMRISEISNLRIENVTEDKINIDAYATQPERAVPLNDPAKEALNNYMKVRPKTDSEFVFVSKNGKPLAVRNIRAAVDRYLQKAGIDEYSVNDLRTTFIIENLKRGVNIIMISQVVGHKRLSTTERYIEMAELEESGNKNSLEEL